MYRMCLLAFGLWTLLVWSSAAYWAERRLFACCGRRWGWWRRRANSGAASIIPAPCWSPQPQLHKLTEETVCFCSLNAFYLLLTFVLSLAVALNTSTSLAAAIAHIPHISIWGFFLMYVCFICSVVYLIKGWELVVCFRPRRLPFCCKATALPDLLHLLKPNQIIRSDWMKGNL